MTIAMRSVYLLADQPQSVVRLSAKSPDISARSMSVAVAVAVVTIVCAAGAFRRRAAQAAGTVAR